MPLAARIDDTALRNAIPRITRSVAERMEAAALAGTHQAGQRLKQSIRREMRSAHLGRLGQAYTAISDQDRGGIQRRYPNGGFSASSTVYVRSQSPRTLGALEAYTRGADIRPKRGRWLWIATDEIQRMVGSGKAKRRVTPALWKSHGLDRKIGPLFLIRSINGAPLLVVQNVGVSAAGKRRSVKGLTKKGTPRKGQIARELVIAFYAVPHTSRRARVDLTSLHRAAYAELPRLIRNSLNRT